MLTLTTILQILAAWLVLSILVAAALSRVFAINPEDDLSDAWLAEQDERIARMLNADRPHVGDTGPVRNVRDLAGGPSSRHRREQI